MTGEAAALFMSGSRMLTVDRPSGRRTGTSGHVFPEPRGRSTFRLPAASRLPARGDEASDHLIDSISEKLFTLWDAFDTSV
jgi:hypothetical protein